MVRGFLIHMLPHRSQKSQSYAFIYQKKGIPRNMPNGYHSTN
ncbi:hypothetical protein XBKB1_530035 [Xenorhabdus bovienii str. kraussei Becker Underwood]|uniref:Uncharacterized protein n=1 Tax=Xenorhabdus bovienii str. kraussei Becker Underwood TaxID=1398204 RepID=A0A077PYG2_XENBV|nr:hypothetical protein XBKB1_530035 [Xenorhabdus bovienii str. kraussei Becker Underwood]